ncbi:MAG: FHA domain-containing protein [Gammaproteobacteria bacterium]|nr:FHA domain-containing protein [Gammaproteobacteria bacterium]
MNLVIEEINRARKVLHRHKFFDKTILMIGRALDNDIVLSEPHVSPYHAELRLGDDNKWKIYDLDSTNGIRSERRKPIESGSVIESGSTFLLGRCYLSIWDQQHPVEETWPLHSVEEVFHRLSHAGVVLILLAALIFGEWQFAVLQSYRDLAPSRLVNELLYEVVAVLGWASVWSLSGRILRHDSRFLSHLAVTIVAAMLLQWTPHLLRIVAFNIDFGLWITEVSYFINGLIFASLLWCNFYLAYPQKPMVRIVWSNTIAWGMVLVYLLPPLFDRQGYRGYPLYDSTLMPASLVWEKPDSLNSFLKSTKSLYQFSEVSDGVKEMVESDNQKSKVDTDKDILSKDSPGKDNPNKDSPSKDNPSKDESPIAVDKKNPSDR